MAPALVVAWLCLGCAETGRSGGIRIEQPWSRATPGKVANGVVYLTLVNEGRRPDHLLRVESPLAARAEVHETLREGRLVQMRHRGVVELAPGERKRFEPGGLHIMLMDLADSIEEGQLVPVTLLFERAGRVEITARAAEVGALEPPAQTSAPIEAPVP